MPSMAEAGPGRGQNLEPELKPGILFGWQGPTQLCLLWAALLGGWGQDLESGIKHRHLDLGCGHLNLGLNL